MKAARRRKKTLRGGSSKEGNRFRTHRSVKAPQLKSNDKVDSENRLLE
jgi:hypothetical protein